jgi:hypothetical protein
MWVLEQGYATQSSAEPRTQIPHTGRQTGLDHLRRWFTTDNGIKSRAKDTCRCARRLEGSLAVAANPGVCTAQPRFTPDLRGETGEQACQLGMKLGAIAHTWHKARQRKAKPDPKPTHGALHMPHHPGQRPRIGVRPAVCPAKQRMRPTDTRTHYPGTLQR